MLFRSRLQRDFPRFLKGREEFRGTEKEDIYRIEFADDVFPKNWLEGNVEYPCQHKSKIKMLNK